MARRFEDFWGEYPIESGRQMRAEVRNYIARLNREVSGGDATEDTHRPALKDFIEALHPG